MFKFIAQLIVSATVGLAVAAGSDAGVRGEVQKAWHASNAYIQGSADVAADIFSNVDAGSNVNADVSANANVEANATGENTPAESSSAVQVDGSLTSTLTNTLNVDETLSDVLDVQADGNAEAQTETDASVESEELELTLLQQLGLSLGFGLGE
jgi:hypothetical protein